MTKPDGFHTSSFCAASNCLEVAAPSVEGNTVRVRGGEVLKLGEMVARVYTKKEVDAFVLGVKNGEFDIDETLGVPGRNDGSEEAELGAGIAEQACAPGDVTYTSVTLGSLRLVVLTDNSPRAPSTSAEDEDPTLSFAPPKWARFTQDVKDGALDTFTA